jgi:hypothetical protein
MVDVLSQHIVPMASNINTVIDAMKKRFSLLFGPTEGFCWRRLTITIKENATGAAATIQHNHRIIDMSIIYRFNCLCLLF